MFGNRDIHLQHNGMASYAAPKQNAERLVVREVLSHSRELLKPASENRGALALVLCCLGRGIVLRWTGFTRASRTSLAPFTILKTFESYDGPIASPTFL